MLGRTGTPWNHRWEVGRKAEISGQDKTLKTRGHEVVYWERHKMAGVPVTDKKSQMPPSQETLPVMQLEEGRFV